MLGTSILCTGVKASLSKLFSSFAVVLFFPTQTYFMVLTWVLYGHGMKGLRCLAKSIFTKNIPVFLYLELYWCGFKVLEVLPSEAMVLGSIIVKAEYPSQKVWAQYGDTLKYMQLNGDILKCKYVSTMDPEIFWTLRCERMNVWWET